MIIGIIGAFNEEIEQFIELFKLEKDNNSFREIYTGIFGKKRLIVCNSGIGKVNSASMTQYIIDKYHVDIIINSGCAGSLTDSIHILDVVISSYVTYHDFLPTRIMEFSVPNSGKILADYNLIHLFEEILKEHKKSYFIAPIASGDCFVTDNLLRNRIFEDTEAICVDMESASIGHIAKINSVPFIAIRTISDFSDGVDNFEVDAAHQSSQIVYDAIKRL